MQKRRVLPILQDEKLRTQQLWLAPSPGDNWAVLKRKGTGGLPSHGRAVRPWATAAPPGSRVHRTAPPTPSGLAPPTDLGSASPLPSFYWPNLPRPAPPHLLIYKSPPLGPVNLRSPWAGERPPLAGAGPRGLGRVVSPQPAPGPLPPRPRLSPPF